MSSDLASVKRDLQFAEMAAEDRKWEQVMPRVEKVNAQLAGLGDADASPIAAKLAELTQRAEAAIRAEKSEQIAKAIRRNISAADPSRQAPDRVEAHLQRASEMLEDEEARAFLDPEVAAELKKQIAAVRGESASEGRQAALADLTMIVRTLEEALATSPFSGLEEWDARRRALDLTARLRAGRGLVAGQPAHPDLDAVGRAIDELDGRLDAHWKTWERDQAVARIEESWARTKGEIDGWEQEPDTMSWARFTFDLELPRTLRAIQACASWLHADTILAEAKATHAGDEAVRRVVAEVTRTHGEAAARLHAAFERVLGEAEAAPTATEHRELEKPGALVASVGGWFEGTPYLGGNVERARALQQSWKAAVDELDRLGLELYRQLEAEAEVAWRRIVEELPADASFDPSDRSPRSTPIRFDRIYNRARWDFDGSQDFAIRVNGVAIAGDYAPGIGAALADASRRTRQPTSQHIEWDVIAVVEGPGTVKVRTERELLVKDTGAKLKLESWEPEACVRIRIIALHAGPVAFSSRSE